MAGCRRRSPKPNCISRPCGRYEAFEMFGKQGRKGFRSRCNSGPWSCPILFKKDRRISWPTQSVYPPFPSYRVGPPIFLVFLWRGDGLLANPSADYLKNKQVGIIRPPKSDNPPFPSYRVGPPYTLVLFERAWDLFGHGVSTQAMWVPHKQIKTEIQ